MVQVMKNGAFDYLVKGDDNEKIIPLTHKALEKVGLNRRLRHLESRVAGRHSFKTIQGKSTILKQSIEFARKVASQDTTVLLTSETGTDKRVFANAIHHEIQRSKQFFVANNCSAFGREILENEMFGHNLRECCALIPALL